MLYRKNTTFEQSQLHMHYNFIM